MNNIIAAITKIFNILIFGNLDPTSNELTIRFLKIGNFEINISAFTEMITYVLIGLSTTIMVYYLVDIIILLYKRFTK